MSVLRRGASRFLVVLGYIGSGAVRTRLRLDFSLQFSCAIFSDGAAQCWGRGGGLGHGEEPGNHLGDDEPADAWGLIPAGAEVGSAALGTLSGCFAYIDGTVRCWGAGAAGALGSGATENAFVTPEERPPVSLVAKAVGVAGWSGRMCALLEGGDIQC